MKLDEDNVKDDRRKRGMTMMNGKAIKKTVGPGRKQGREDQMSKINFQKQLNALKKIKEEEKKDYEERINKINLEIADLKVKNLNLQYANDALKIKYKNTVKSITNQCNKKGIKLNITFG